MKHLHTSFCKTQKEVISHDSVDHRSVPVERHFWAHVHRTLDRSRISERLWRDLEGKEDGKTWAFKDTRADGVLLPPVLVKERLFLYQLGTIRLRHGSFGYSFSDAVYIGIARDPHSLAASQQPSTLATAKHISLTDQTWSCHRAGLSLTNMAQTFIAKIAK